MDATASLLLLLLVVVAAAAIEARTTVAVSLQD